MSDFRFETPSWSIAIWGVIVFVALLFWLDRSRSNALENLLSPLMQKRLVARQSPLARWSALLALGLCCAMLVLALMRPQYGLTYRKLPRVGAQLMICIDVSNSMLAEDTAPNRLERAKAEVKDLLPYLEGDQVGLIAFAGRASVACPMTSDFSFFRLVLDTTGPHSVGRGGTRLEEPIRKAMAGFRDSSDSQRAILLITDGEDHDSFPTEAAKDAAERGIKIISIGFGDEAGSTISMTNDDTGVRSTLRDADGREVITRLDGETLRELAMTTEGAYVPAGTGMLDLASIYKSHIAPLTRGQISEEGQAVQSEAFQWAVLAGMCCLVVALVVANTRSERLRSAHDLEFTSTTAKAATWLLFASVCYAAVPNTLLFAQQPPSLSSEENIGVAGVDQREPPARSTGGSALLRPQPPNSNAEPTTSTSAVEIPEDPRDAYNEALAMLDDDVDTAERFLSHARSEAGTDGEVRFRCSYNLGWVEIHRADEKLEASPEEALEHLKGAADWFRDAVRLRPENVDARHNLEVVQRRVMELADAVRKKDERDLAQLLDELIATQRELTGQASDVVQRLAAIDDPHAADQFRSDFRQLAIAQREILSDTQAFTADARDELEALNGKKPDELSPEERVRSAQLNNVLHFANQANQRLGQARSQMRRRQGARAFRRAAAGLDELKRARDQLRNPIEVLGVIVADAMHTAQLTAQFANANGVVATGNDEAQIPAWLTIDYLEESQRMLTERTSQLHAQLSAAVEQPTDETKQIDEETSRTLQQIRTALPFIEQGKTSFGEADAALQSADAATASGRQVDAIVALQRAQERFLDVKGLVELTFQKESQIQQIMSAIENAGDDRPTVSTSQLFQVIAPQQDENNDRATRLSAMLEEELTKANAAAAQDNGADPNAIGPALPPQQQPATDKEPTPEQQRYQLANVLLKAAQDEMTAARASMTIDQREQTGPVPPEPKTNQLTPKFKESKKHVDLAVERLHELRRLFYSIVEHLRETAQRQMELNDQTQQAVTLTEPSKLTQELGPLASRQQELQLISQQIAEGLSEQASQSPPVDPSAQADPDAQQQQQAMQEKFEQAAKLVDEGSTLMSDAVGHMGEASRDLEQARSTQDSALEKLAEALSLLQPPQDQQQQQNNQDQQQEQQQSESSEEKKDEQQGRDPSQLLQAVRDREAKRREDREKRRVGGQEPVEKNW